METSLRSKEFLHPGGNWSEEVETSGLPATQYSFLNDQDLERLEKTQEANRKALIVGVAYDAPSQSLWVIRADSRRFKVPMSFFEPSGMASPDPARLSVEDFGHTIKMGDYEAASDAILHAAVAVD